MKLIAKVLRKVIWKKELADSLQEVHFEFPYPVPEIHFVAGPYVVGQTSFGDNQTLHTYFFSEAGLNAVEEMALGFIELRHIVRQLLNRGVDIDSFAPRIAILVNCSMDFFEEIAKIRATRRQFARMMKEEFGAKDPRSLAVVITSHTSGLSLTALSRSSLSGPWGGKASLFQPLP